MYEIFEQLLQKYDLTAYKVAKEAGVTQTALSNWKTGKSTPTTKTLQKIADFFGVSIDYLMTGKETEDSKYYLNDETAEMKILDYIMMVIFVTDFVFALLVLSLLIASFFLVF